MTSHFHNAISTFLVICSEIQPDDDPIVSRHVAVRIICEVVVDGYLFVAYFIVQHRGTHN